MSTHFLRLDGKWIEAEACEIPKNAHRWDVFLKMDTPVVVHTKLWGKYKKMTPVTAIGIFKDAYDVKLLVRTEDGHIESIMADTTSEGHKFKRVVIRAFKELLRAAREGQKIRKSREALAKIAAERGHKEGQCPCCLGDFIVKDGTMVFHGYQRPGDGHTVGQCFGMKYPPLEVSKEGLVAYIAYLKDIRTNQEARLQTVSTLDELFRAPRWFGDKGKDVKRGDADFESVRTEIIKRIEGEIRSVTAHIAVSERYEREWAPRPFPRRKAP